MLPEVTHMAHLRDNPFDNTRDVVITLRDLAIEASLADLKRQDDLTIALRDALDNGMDINDLSAASGLTPQAIRARVERELHLHGDLDRLVR